MPKFFLTLILFFSLFSLNACAAQQADAVAQGDNSITEALTQFYPQLEYEEVSPTPVAGLYEVFMSDGQIVYFAPATGHLLLGELWSADARNLTRESKNKRLSARVGEIPLDLAVKVGDGPNQLIEFTDPDCPFCRESSAFFAGRDDCTRYVFLFPLTRIHPNAEAKARFILNSEDPETAYEDVFSGKYDETPVPAVTADNGLLAKHQALAKEIGINGTPQVWVNGEHVSGFQPEEFEKLLSN